MTKYGHACVRLEEGDRVLVIDPGTLSEVESLSGCPNLGFIVDGVYHPGDSLFVPAEAVDTLLVPASGPWVKHGEAVEFVRAVGPARSFPIHDAHFSEVGRDNFDGWLDAKGGTDYARIPVGESVNLQGL
ncbi:hypothetical protein QMK19_35515 [Streptomyces sp. H10-C2]|uniref:MBL fold metallo-hydrolase n=1 Tax=unclassified Streptomyces TaxID=2593676 RepID=UPI0024B94889|nr:MULTISPECIES: hypothetical protein [unclassified Streptomyces]MDJ0345944.1 hypothetical protein [Streptomyces sp. PH10-H1]MDJ0374793.1 hypothetical protein [Streptomyces sp. H10-C2]